MDTVRSELSPPIRTPTFRSSIFGRDPQKGWEKVGTNVLEADQADTRHAKTADQFRTEWLGQDLVEGVRVYPKVDQNPPFNDPSDARNLHRHASWFQ